MIRVGITGGIGSGKSYVARIFSHLGVPVFNSDIAGRTLLENDPDVKKQIRNSISEAVFEGDQINRKALGAIVFKDPGKLHLLNKIIHPAVNRRYEEWVRQTDYPYHLKEAAILIESGFHKGLDHLILVIAPVDERVARVRNRDNATEDSVRERMKHQLSDEEKLKYADHVIDNADGKMLLPQVLHLHTMFSKRK